MAPASYISNCAVFAAGDLLRRVSLVAYRTRQLADATGYPSAAPNGFAWERTRPGSGREAVEKLLTAYAGRMFHRHEPGPAAPLEPHPARQLATAAQGNGDD